MSIAADAGDPLTLFALTRDSSPVLKSGDGGDHWTALESPPSFARGLTGDPSEAGVLFAYGAGVSTSDDAGITWHDRNEGFGCPTPDELPEISALAIAPSDSSVVYAGTAAISVCRETLASATFYRSTAAGALWSATNFPSGTGEVNGIAIDPADPDSLLVATATGLFRSADAGSSWTAAPGLSSANFSAVAWSSFDSARAFASASEIEPSGATVETLYRSADAGASWEPIATLSNETVSTIVTTLPAIVLAGVQRNAIYRSSDGGDSWRVSNSGIRAVPEVSIAVSPPASSRIWAGTADGRVFRSDDAGGSWKETGLDEPGGVDVAPDPKRPFIVYAAVTSYPNGPFVPLGKVFKSVDAGAHWTEVDDGLMGLPVSVTVDPLNPEVVYASGGSLHGGTGAFKSLDGATTWGQLGTGAIQLFPYDVLGGITVDPRDPMRLLMCSGAGLDRSEDGGESWSTVLPGTFGAVLAVGDASATELIATQDGILRSVDHGDHWALSGRGVIADALSESPGRGHAVYASGRPGHAWVSVNAGLTWSGLGLNGIPAGVGIDIVSNGTRLFGASYSGIYAAPAPSLILPVTPSPTPPLVTGR